MNKIDFRANKIWCEDNTRKNDWVVFRKKVYIDIAKTTVIAKIAVDTKYYLYVNGELVVFEGGLNWGPYNNAGYYDTVDIAKYLVNGNNIISLLCWYWGNQGRNNVDSQSAGLIFEAEEISVFSGEEFKVLRHPSYGDTNGDQPAYLYGGYNIGFDARKDILDYTAYDFDESDFKNAIIYEIKNEYYMRPIPLNKFSCINSYKEIIQTDCNVTAKLQHAAQITPYFEVMANNGDVIDIRTDRYPTNGGPGDEHILFNSQRVEYICKKGLNRFEALNWLFGEEVIYEFPKGIQIINLGYRESGYNADIVGMFKCNDELINKLVEKCKRTLYVCMRDNFMDCPDRERGQWIGDVSIQVPQAFFVMDKKAVKLIRKAIHNFISLRKGKVFVGNVPGVHSTELASQNLNAISEVGMIAQYYKYSGDKSVLSLCFQPIIDYLQLWEMKEDGLISKREGDWYWFDHLYNVDEKVLENAWYYSALKFSEFIANQIDCHTYDQFIENRKASIEANYNRLFWNGNFYSSCNCVDDRANAMAVISGLASEDKYIKIKRILVSVFNSTPYMEAYVLDALVKMGYKEEAFKRMMSRYYNLIQNENSTLWEDFYGLCTRNHAWSGGPLTILFKHFAGIDTNNGYENVDIAPDLSMLNYFECETHLLDGNFRIYACKKDNKISINILNNSVSKCNLILNARNLGIENIRIINGEDVHKDKEIHFTLISGENTFIVE